MILYHSQCSKVNSSGAVWHLISFLKVCWETANVRVTNTEHSSAKRQRDPRGWEQTPGPPYPGTPPPLTYNHPSPQLTHRFLPRSWGPANTRGHSQPRHRWASRLSGAPHLTRGDAGRGPRPPHPVLRASPAATDSRPLTPADPAAPRRAARPEAPAPGHLPQGPERAAAAPGARTPCGPGRRGERASGRAGGRARRGRTPAAPPRAARWRRRRRAEPSAAAARLAGSFPSPPQPRAGSGGQRGAGPRDAAGPRFRR